MNRRKYRSAALSATSLCPILPLALLSRMVTCARFKSGVSCLKQICLGHSTRAQAVPPSPKLQATCKHIQPSHPVHDCIAPFAPFAPTGGTVQLACLIFSYSLTPSSFLSAPSCFRFTLTSMSGLSGPHCLNSELCLGRVPRAFEQNPDKDFHLVIQ